MHAMWIGWQVFGTAAAQAAPAFDATSSTCGAPTFAASLPAAGAVDVPIDVIPTVLFSSGGCGLFGWSASLLDSAGQGLMDFEVLGEQRNNVIVAQFDLGDDLLPDTAYTLRLVGYDTVDIPFTTGDAPSGDEGPAAPTASLTVDAISWSGPILLVDGVLSVSDIPEDVVVVAGDTAAVADGPTLDVDIHAGVQPGVDLCETVSVIDLAGRESEPARACAPVPVPERPDDGVDPGEEDVRGCSTVPGGGALGLALVGLGLALARRRTR